MRYYFEIQDNGLTYPDDVGTDLQSFQEARAESVRILAEMIRNMDPIARKRQIAVAVYQPKGRRLMRATITLEVDQP